jgi:hypothetical protein
VIPLLESALPRIRERQLALRTPHHDLFHT